MLEAPRTRGRPRSSHADRAIATATLALLASGGFSSLKIEHVAERAGVGKTTIYRRWPTKQALVAAALAEFVDDFPVPDSGESRHDLIAVLRYQLGLLTGGFGQVAATVLSEAAFHPVLAEALRGPLRRSRELLGAVLTRAVERGELRAGLDLERAIDLFWGPVYYRFLTSVIENRPVPPAYIDAVVADVWSALAP
jgi:AcrR family transcriptional regulator